MAESLGVNIVVENRPGAGGNIAAEIVATANPNGYTLYWSSVGPLTVSPALGIKLPYHPLEDFAPISMGVQSCNVLSARPGFRRIRWQKLSRSQSQTWTIEIQHPGHRFDGPPVGSTI